MSPAKPARKTTNTLTIHFSGICTFVWDRKRGSAEVRMVDLASAGFQQHYAALGIAITEDTPRAITAPDADAAVSLAAMNTDMGLWNLIGTDVKIVGGKGKLTVDDSKSGREQEAGEDSGEHPLAAQPGRADRVGCGQSRCARFRRLWRFLRGTSPATRASALRRWNSSTAARPSSRTATTCRD